jgi:putative thiazole/oxazole-modified microcin (TOMM)-like peptide
MTTPIPVPPEHRSQFARLVADAWSDEALARRYTAEPLVVLAEYGVTLAADQTAPALPSAPVDIALEELGTSAGAALATIGTVSCPSACAVFAP